MYGRRSSQIALENVSHIGGGRVVLNAVALGRVLNTVPRVRYGTLFETALEIVSPIMIIPGRSKAFARQDTLI